MEGRIAPTRSVAPVAAVAEAPAAAGAPKPPCRVFTVNSVETPAAAAPAALPAGPLSARTPLPATPAAAGSFEHGAKQVLGRMLEHERTVDRGLRGALSGRSMSPQELLVLQAQVIQYSQELEVASRLVDKVTGGIKQVMQTQV